MTALRFGPYRVEVSNQDKVLFPDAGISKGALVAYYRNVAERALPHLRERPLVLHRFPEGVGEEGFFQQDAGRDVPAWVQRAPVRTRGDRTVEHVVCSNEATLACLANLACIELHAWSSRRDALERPDRLIFDLDPDDGDFHAVRDAARALRALLEELGLVPFVETTGSRGLHVVVPLDRSASFDRVRAFARDVARIAVSRDPRRLTVAQPKHERRGRVYIDVLRNAYGQTTVAPYSVRARAGAPVATPLAWSELGDRELRADRWTVRNVLRRLGQREDPWTGIGRRARSLEKPRRRLDALRRAHD